MMIKGTKEERPKLQGKRRNIADNKWSKRLNSVSMVKIRQKHFVNCFAEFR